MKKLDPSLSEIPRHELIAAALELGITRPEELSPEQLREEIRTASATSQPALPVLGKRALFAVARNLIASVVERGLNLPDAARVIRDTVRPSPKQRPPLPTVTLAQIYLTQGYTDKALQTLVQVIEREPNNYSAVALQQKLLHQDQSHKAHLGAPDSVESIAYTSPSIAPEPLLWYTGSELTLGTRNALALIRPLANGELNEASGELPAARLYWELSSEAAAHLISKPLEVCLRCYSERELDCREVLLLVHSPCGWAEVELSAGESPVACLRYVSGKLLVSAVNVHTEASRCNITKHRKLGYYDDVVRRALA
jgi:hypothetical protein